MQKLGLSAAIVAVCDDAVFAVDNAGAAAGGISPDAVRAFIDAAANGGFELHSLVVQHHGVPAARAFWAPYRADAPQLLYSLSKSFTSTAVGFAVTDGKLKLTDKVIDFFPDQKPAQVSEHLDALTVKHLLTMSVGHATDSTPAVTHEQDWVKAFLALPIENAPGSTFVYDSAATYMLSAILQKVTGERAADYLKPRFFDPLGLPAMPWQTCPRGINTGGWGLSATTDTLAKFGQFYLQRGQWQGRQLLPAAWIDEATSFKIQQPAPPGQDLEHVKQISDWHQGYCYQIWRCRHDAYRGDGAFGQYVIVLPKVDAVIAITSRTLDMQGLINIVWDTLLPGLEHGASSKATAQIDGLSLKMPDGATTSPRQSKKYAFVLDDNSLGIKKLSVAFDKNDCTLAFDTHTITSGIARWHDNTTDLPGTPPEWIELVGNSRNAPGPVKLAAAGAWKDADTFVMEWRYYETPHFDTVTLHFVGDAIEVTFLNSLTQMAGAMHPETRPVLKGKARV